MPFRDNGDGAHRRVRRLCGVYCKREGAVDVAFVEYGLSDGYPAPSVEEGVIACAEQLIAWVACTVLKVGMCCEG